MLCSSGITVLSEILSSLMLIINESVQSMAVNLSNIPKVAVERDEAITGSRRIERRALVAALPPEGAFVQRNGDNDQSDVQCTPLPFDTSQPSMYDATLWQEQLSILPIPDDQFDYLYLTLRPKTNRFVSTGGRNPRCRLAASRRASTGGTKYICNRPDLRSGREAH